MTQKFKRYSSTIQFSGVVKQVRDHCRYHNLPLPTLKFTGSTKIHGTCSTVGLDPSGNIWFQSRERVITYESDNAGFATFGECHIREFKEIYEIVCSEHDIEHDQFYITGEWFGPGINNSVSVNQLPEKKFGIFEMIFVKDQVVTRINPCNYHLRINTMLPNTVVIDYIIPPVEIEIDFNNPSLVQNLLLEKVLEVEEMCPVGKYFGVTTGCTVGEGLVFATTDVSWLSKFKVKGEKHVSCKVTTQRELTDAEIASKSNAIEFVEYACTQNRLEQGILKLGELGLDVDIKNMGTFIRWVFTDAVTEEKEVLLKSNIDKKDIGSLIANKSRYWFTDYLNKQLGVL